MHLSEISKSLYCIRCVFVFILLISTVCFTQACSASLPATVEQESDYDPAAAIDINSANVDELKRLPGVGEKLAGKIVEHREHYGPFRRIEHLLLIDGISENRFRELRPFIKIVRTD